MEHTVVLEICIVATPRSASSLLSADGFDGED